MYVSTDDYYKVGVIITYLYLIFTCVSGAVLNLYFLRIVSSAILASIKANLAPTQLRGPHPNGI